MSALRSARSSAFLLSALLVACTPGRIGTTDGQDASTSPRSDAGGPPACTGCVDPLTGACLRGTTDTACGPSGGACEVCGDGRTCVERACVERAGCTPDDCPGCCDGTLCVTTLRDDACGEGGAACMACASGERCVDGTCEPLAACGPDDCEGCCDPEGACAPGDTVESCGQGGGVCTACDAGWSCIEGVCTPPCSEHCRGCCDGETCIEDAVDGACGQGGDACVDCGASASCSGGVCVPRACSDTCGGCCDGDVCLSGTLSGACGARGGVCIDCGASFSCTSGACLVDPASRWNLHVERASFSAFNPGGNPWDAAGGLPDPYATGEVSSSSGAVQSGRTMRVDNTITPVWNELLLENIPARDLQRGVTIRVLDYDTFNPDDDIGWCYWRPSDNAFNVRRINLICPARAADPETIAIELRVRLERH